MSWEVLNLLDHLGEHLRWWLGCPLGDLGAHLMSAPRLWKVWVNVPSPEAFFQPLYVSHSGDFKVSALDPVMSVLSGSPPPPSVRTPSPSPQAQPAWSRLGLLLAKCRKHSGGRTGIRIKQDRAAFPNPGRRRGRARCTLGQRLAFCSFLRCSLMRVEREQVLGRVCTGLKNTPPPRQAPTAARTAGAHGFPGLIYCLTPAQGGLGRMW